jgi:FkbM family methyltransferase
MGSDPDKIGLEAHVRRFIKNLLKGGADVYDLERRVAGAEAAALEAVERGVTGEMMKALGTSIATRLDDIRNDVDMLREHIQYTLVREIDLVRYDSDFYYWYTNDVSYEWLERHAPLVTKNYTLRSEDLVPPKLLDISPAEYLARGLYKKDLKETGLKNPIFLHLWAHGVDFTFIDVGANVGSSAIPVAKFSQSLGKETKIVSFEPGFVHELVKHNIRINNVERLVRLEQKAVSDLDAAAVFSSLLRHSECNSVRDFRVFYPELKLARSTLVPTVRLDTYVRENGIETPLVVKIDAEGNDWPVIKGMGDLIPAVALAIFVEFVPRYMSDGMHAREVLAFLCRNHTLLNMRTVDQSLRWMYDSVVHADEIDAFTERVAQSPAGWTDIAAISKYTPQHDALVDTLLAWGREAAATAI